MGEGAMLIHACDLVTRAADFRLRRRLEDGIPIRVTAMTAAACYFVDRMRTRVPPGAELLLVAGSAHTVLGCHRRVGRSPESHDRRALLSLRRLASVQAARTMTGFALELTLPEG
jgi:hypothetical protein